MATIGGPNTEKDNLVFGYDTGYGVADNTTATRFYPGEVTTNQADTDAKRNWGTHGGAASSTAAAPEKGLGWKKLTITNIYGNNYRLAQFPYLTQADGTNRTYSVEYDVTGLTGYFLFVDGSSGYSQTSISGRGRYSFTTGVISGNKSLALFIGKSGTHSSINDVIYYKEYQVEVKGHATPFTATSRSSTQSLIDLTRTTDIDVSNISFDSTGQPTFDGTDDRIDIPVIALTDFTVTQVLKMDDVDNQMPIGGGLYSNGSDYRGYTWFFKGQNQVRIKVDGEVGPNFGVNTSVWADKWISYTATRSGSTYKLYINGELLDTQTSSTNQYSVRTIGWGYSNSYAMQGDLAVTKVYNRALTADEIQQNFNAYKNRFDI